MAESVAPRERRTAGGDRRCLPDKGGRRRGDPILELATHPFASVTPSQLAPWWGVTEETVLRWIHVGHRTYGRLYARHRGTREWSVPIGEARRFERRLFEYEPRRPLVVVCPGCGRPR